MATELRGCAVNMRCTARTAHRVPRTTRPHAPPHAPSQTTSLQTPSLPRGARCSGGRPREGGGTAEGSAAEGASWERCRGAAGGAAEEQQLAPAPPVPVGGGGAARRCEGEATPWACQRMTPVPRPQVKGSGHRRAEDQRPGGQATRSDSSRPEAERAEDGATHAKTHQGGLAPFAVSTTFWCVVLNMSV